MILQGGFSAFSMAYSPFETSLSKHQNQTTSSSAFHFISVSAGTFYSRIVAAHLSDQVYPALPYPLYVKRTDHQATLILQWIFILE